MKLNALIAFLITSIVTNIVYGSPLQPYSHSRSLEVRKLLNTTMTSSSFAISTLTANQTILLYQSFASTSILVISIYGIIGGVLDHFLSQTSVVFILYWTLVNLFRLLYKFGNSKMSANDFIQELTFHRIDIEMFLYCILFWSYLNKSMGGWFFLPLIIRDFHFVFYSILVLLSILLPNEIEFKSSLLSIVSENYGYLSNNAMIDTLLQIIGVLLESQMLMRYFFDKHAKSSSKLSLFALSGSYMIRRTDVLRTSTARTLRKDSLNSNITNTF